MVCPERKVIDDEMDSDMTISSNGIRRKQVITNSVALLPPDSSTMLHGVSMYVTPTRCLGRDIRK